MRRSNRLLLFAVAVGLLLTIAVFGNPATAEGPAAPVRAEAVRAEVARLLKDLDGQRYAVRQKAAQRLRQLVDQPALGRVLSEEFQRVLLSSETSLEVRSELERLRAKLPQATAEPDDQISPEEIGRLVAQLDAPSYAARVGASKRLHWLLGNPKLVTPVTAALRQRLSAGGLSHDARRWFEPLWQRARGLWLSTDPAQWRLPPVSEVQIQRWVDDLTQPEADGAKAGSAPRRAQRELRDLLARDQYVARVREMMEKRLGEGGIDPKATKRLVELIELCRPAMVAEYWQQRHHLGIQHLLIGVPSQAPGATRPSHFDRIDDNVAHCVSGSNLRNGNYPVGVAIPHPNQADAVFHLVNLSTPRRRMAYEYLSKTDESQRFRDLSRRTCERLLRSKRPLEIVELRMLPQLSPPEVSRFAGRFFAAVDDQPVPREGAAWPGGLPSRHGVLCALLAEEGTRAAVDGLLAAIDNERFLPPDRSAPYELAWVAALSIAGRDPWPEVDAWLAGLIQQTDPLRIASDEDGPELGATAAAMLLARHGQTASRFGLAPVEDELLDDLHVAAYRFVGPESREKVVQWWKTAEQLEKAAG